MTLWRPVGWMAGVAGLVWAGLSAATGWRYEPELGLGMVGPLLIASASWLAMARASALGPERLMGVMMRLFALKMVLFGAYVTVLLGVFHLRRIPFVGSFAGFFIALYAMEALFLMRLVTTGAPAPRA
jgi:hypothetical protein